MTRLHINTGYDLSGSGLPPILPPFPSLSGSLYAAYCFGDDYPALGTDPLSSRYGIRFDWSGNGRHLSTLGSSVFGDWYFTASSSIDTPLTPFTLTEMATGGEASVVVFARTIATAKAVSLARSQNVAPYMQLSLLPQATSGTAKAVMNNGVGNDAAVTDIGTDLTEISLYGGSYRTTDRTVWQAGPATPLQSDVNTTDVAVTSDGTFHFGVEASTGDTGSTRIYAAAFYDAYLSSSQITEIHETFRAWHAAAESGLTI